MEPAKDINFTEDRLLRMVTLNFEVHEIHIQNILRTIMVFFETPLIGVGIINELRFQVRPRT
jgi:hypothetical protein